MTSEITSAQAGTSRAGRSSSFWAFLVTGVAIFMVSLDNLVVTTALPAIRAGLGAGLEGLEWTVNAYTLTFAVFLLTGAALGDRFGRRRMFLIGLSLFTVSSAAAAVAPDIGMLIAARAVQGVGAAIVAPLTLTLLSAAVPATKRGLALGAWGAMSGLAVALGPVIGGAIVDYVSWQWIFWVNVPIGVALIPVARRRLAESYGPTGRLDLVGTVLASAGLLGVVLGLVRGNGLGWTSPEILISFAAGAILLAGFVAWELRSAAPMLPMRFFRSRSFSAANVASLLMFFGMFGSIFLLAQFLQTVQGYSPFAAGVRTLPWTGMPLIAAPLAGALSDRIGSRPIVTVGLALQAIGLAWLAMISAPDVAYSTLVPAFIVSGLGMGMFFAPIANLVLGAVSSAEEGMASGANNAIREVGGVLGVAVLAAVFSKTGGYTSGQAFVDGLIPAVWVGAVAVAGAVVAAVLVPRRSRVGGEVTAMPGQRVREPVAA